MHTFWTHDPLTIKSFSFFSIVILHLIVENNPISLKMDYAHGIFTIQIS